MSLCYEDRYKVTIDTILKKCKKFKKLFYSAITLTFIFNLNIPSKGSEREVKVYSGRHYNTDRGVYKKFADETGIKVRLIEAAGISLIERLKREGKNSQADLILLVDAAKLQMPQKQDCFKVLIRQVWKMMFQRV